MQMTEGAEAEHTRQGWELRAKKASRGGAIRTGTEVAGQVPTLFTGRIYWESGR